jgi:lipopolysaccharide transport system permease protein
MEYEIKPAKGLQFNFRELWEFRELIYFFTLRDVKIKYKQTVIGIAWAILQPFLFMVIFTTFFASRFHLDSSLLPYPLFVFSGLMFWNIFSSGITYGGNSMVSNAHIITKIYFPRLIIPIASIMATLIDFSMTFLLFIGLFFWYGPETLSWKFLPVLPIVLLITLFTTIGLGTLIAAMNVKYRDFRYIIPFMIQILMFLSPVIYPVTIIENQMIREILLLNPLAGAIDLFRNGLAGIPLDYVVLFKSLFISMILFVSGVSYFRKTEYYFADLA